jgi:hypothetical protein
MTGRAAKVAENAMFLHIAETLMREEGIEVELKCQVRRVSVQPRKSFVSEAWETALVLVFCDNEATAPGILFPLLA